MAGGIGGGIGGGAGGAAFAGAASISGRASIVVDGKRVPLESSSQLKVSSSEFAQGRDTPRRTRRRSVRRN